MTPEEKAERDALARMLDTLINIAGAYQQQPEPRPLLVEKKPWLLTGSDEPLWKRAVA